MFFNCSLQPPSRISSLSQLSPPPPSQPYLSLPTPRPFPQLVSYRPRPSLPPNLHLPPPQPQPDRVPAKKRFSWWKVTGVGILISCLGVSILVHVLLLWSRGKHIDIPIRITYFDTQLMNGKFEFSRMYRNQLRVFNMIWIIFSYFEDISESSVQEFLYNSDLRLGPEFDFNKQPSLNYGSRPLTDFNAFGNYTQFTAMRGSCKNSKYNNHHLVSE